MFAIFISFGYASNPVVCYIIADLPVAADLPSIMDEYVCTHCSLESASSSLPKLYRNTPIGATIFYSFSMHLDGDVEKYDGYTKRHFVNYDGGVIPGFGISYLLHVLQKNQSFTEYVSFQ